MARPSTAPGALRWILLATATAGLLGYVIQVAAPRLLDENAYVAFSVMWSTIYLCVAAMSGVQQEVSRAARPSADHEPSTVLRTFTLAAIAAGVLVSVALGLWLSLTTVHIPFLALAAIFCIGFAGYLANAVLSGVLYGLHEWRGVALLTGLDAILRTVFIGIGLAMDANPVWLGLGIAFPFGLSFTLAWILLRTRVVGRFALDVSSRRLSRNVLSTVGSAACSGIMISGLPLLLGATSAGVPASALGALIMTINLTRATIVVPVIALQSYLISAVFRNRTSIRPRRLFGLLGAALVLTACISAVAFLVGPLLVSVFSAGGYEIAPVTIAVVVFSAGLVALMCITGPALLAEGRHSANVAGWLIAAALTVVCLVLPTDFTPTTLVALTLPAVAGLVVHVSALLRPKPNATSSKASLLPG